MDNVLWKKSVPDDKKLSPYICVSLELAELRNTEFYQSVQKEKNLKGILSQTTETRP